jgi:hypothetical protein
MGQDIQLDATLGGRRSSAIRVGEWYLHSRSAHRDAQVVGAYRQLQAETDRLFTLLTREACHWAVRVAFTRCAQPYESDAELISAVRATGTLEVTSAAVAGQRLHPLIGCEFGGAFDRFRAVHDLLGHAWFGFGFELDDECAAWSFQDRLHTGLARFALATELYGVNAARSITGESPDLRALLLPASVWNPQSSSPRRVESQRHRPTSMRCRVNLTHPRLVHTSPINERASSGPTTRS